MTRLLPLVWGLAITAGAIWVRRAHPQDTSALLTRAMDSELVHVLAHTALYATLALLARRFLWNDWARVLGVVLSLGLVQELAQVVGGRGLGMPEVVDLGVDGVSAMVACWVGGRWAAVVRNLG